MTSVFSWQNSISLCPTSFHIPRPMLPVTPGVSWLPTFAFQSPLWKGHLFWLLFLEGLVGLHRTFNFSFFSITGWVIDLDYCDIEWFALEMNRDHSVIFEIAPKYRISDSFVDYDGYSISSKEFLPIIVDIMVIWVKSSRYNGYLCCGTVTTQETNPDLPMNVQESLAEVWVSGGLLQGQGLQGNFWRR